MLAALRPTLLLLAALLLAPARARAQPTASDRSTSDLAEAEARASFEAGRVAYAAGRFDRAYEDFARAYELSARPALLYNMALAADRLRRDDDAVALYERYLAALPDAENRASVEERLAFLRARARDRAAPVDSGPPVGPIVVLSSGGAVALAGAILVGVGAADRSAVTDAADGSTWADVRDAYERSAPLTNVGISLLAVGAAAIAAGALWWALDGPAPRDELALGVGLGSVSLRGSFR